MDGWMGAYKVYGQALGYPFDHPGQLTNRRREGGGRLPRVIDRLIGLSIMSITRLGPGLEACFLIV